MIHEEICTYEVCKLAKEKGFPLRKVIKQDGRAFFYELPQSHPDWANCDAWYIPTQSLLQRWLREEKGIHINIDRDLDFNEKDYIYEWQASHKKDLGDGCYRIITASDMEFYPTYEETLNAALKYALENLI